MDAFMKAAIEEAKKGLGEGGIPIDAVLRAITVLNRANYRYKQKEIFC